MAQIYGELIRAQLQVSASDLGSPAAGLIYFNSTTGAKWYSGSAWKTAVDLDSSQTLANKSLDATCSINSGILPVVPLTKGGLGADASAWSGLVKISGGVASASSLALTDIPDTLITYAKLNLADGDIPQAKVSGLVTDLAGKLTGNAAITGETKTKITYDSKGLVTAGADLAAGDLPTGIDATKIADGSVDNTEFQKLGTAGTSGAGLLVTTDGLQTLSNKTLASPGVTGNMLVADTADIRFLENGGLDTVVLKGPPSLAATYTFTLPSTPGQANQVLKTDGTGITSWGAGGSGAGGINYLSDYFDATTSISSVSNIAANGNITVNGSTPLLTSAWYADATSGSSAIARSTSTALRGSYNYLTALSGTSTSGDTFVQTSAFNVDSSDLGKPVTVSFDLTGVTTDNDWDIVVARYSTTGSSGTGTFVELIPVAGNVSTVTGTPGAKLPTGTTQFKGFFIASSTANDVYALRLRRRAGSAQVRLDSLFVGPQSLAQGAVVTAFADAATPASGWFVTGPTNVTTTVKQARIGTEAHLKYAVIATGSSAAFSELSINLPANLTVDTTAINRTSSGRAPIGRFELTKPGVGNYTGVVYYEGSAFVCRYLGSTAIPSSIGNTSPINWDTTTAATSINIDIIIPISQWSSGTTTLADRVVEEFVSHDGTNIVRGPAGSLVPNVPFSTSATGLTVDFQQALNATDSFVLEFSRNNLGWQNAADLYPYSSGNNGSTANFYGMRVYKLNATQYTVEFGNQGNRVSVSNQNAGAGSWASEYASGTRWRLRKVSGGAAVGFPVSARNIVGDTSGTAVPAGYVGEIAQGTLRNGTGGFTYSAQSSTAPSGTSATTLVSLTLNKGTYLVSWKSEMYVTSGNPSSDGVFVTRVGGTQIDNQTIHTFMVGQNGTQTKTIPIIISSDSTVVSLVVTAGTSTNWGNPLHEMWAIRIA